MDDKEIFEKVYEKTGAVWTKTQPSKELVELIETGKVKPCKTVDLGCGEGFYSIYLASKGFDVTGIDISERAVRYAKENAAETGVKIKFMAIDVSDLHKLKDKFDFILEWALMHHIMPQQRQKYAEDVNRILKKGGKYMSVSFNEKSHTFSGPGEKYRKSGERAPGLKMYFSSLEELKELFGQYFKIIEAKLIEVPSVGFEKPHTENYLFMEKP
ncbi:MAG: class I SAM-dependent methyltransferase [Candidatus Aenigmarchaeota archaeon]|nr:class I SAM-dependent methyltransferase [Candidatus Aenigmarchaeota archaeon]